MLIRFFIFFLFASLTFAQEFSFVGLVVSDGKPLKGVNVFLKESNIGTITNNDGQFVINSYIGNSQKLIFSFVGYKPVVKIISPSNLNIGIIELLPDETLEEVVVSSTLKPVSKLDSPTPVEVYSQSFLRQILQLQFLNLLEILMVSDHN